MKRESQAAEGESAVLDQPIQQIVVRDIRKRDVPPVAVGLVPLGGHIKGVGIPGPGPA